MAGAQRRGALLSVGVEVVAGVCQGLRVCGSVARPFDSGLSGKTSAPFCPQPLSKAARPARRWPMTRILAMLNIRRL